MLEKIIRRIRWKCHFLNRILQEKPEVLLRYARGWLFIRVILYLLCALVYLFVSAFLSAEVRSLVDLRKLWEFLDAERLWLLCRETYGQLRLLNFEKIGMFLERAWLFCKTIPSELRKGFNDFCRLLSEKRRLLWAFLLSLWPPAAVWERLCTFCERNKQRLKNMAEKTMGVVIAFAMLKIVVFFILPLFPLLGLGALTFFGLDAGLLLIIILQWCISLVAPKFARELRHKAENAWRRLIPAEKRKEIEQKVEGYAKRIADKIEEIQSHYEADVEREARLPHMNQMKY